jgi:predicted ATPase
MIDTLHVQGFKSLRDTSLTLRPFTVLIGPNDSGKSSILDAIRFLGRTREEALAELGAQSLTELAWMGRAEEIRWVVTGSTPALPFRYEVALDEAVVVSEFLSVAGDPLLNSSRRGAQAVYASPGAMKSFPTYASPGLPRPGLFEVSDRRWDLALNAMRSSKRYHFDATALCELRPFVEMPALTSRGHQLAGALDRILGDDRDAFAAIEETLRRLVPPLQGLSLRTVMIDGRTPAKALDFILKSNGSKVRIPATQASEGALLLTAYLALVYGDTPEILLIEEPENGLHPKRLKEVIQLFRDISTGKVGNRPRQVIVTTHNPILLNEAQPEEVRVVTRSLEGGTSVKNFDELPDIRAHLDEFGIGELWYLLGEDALLKGVAP